MSGKTILVATDFSTRSDRALRRATLLARDLKAKLVLAHVVDDDQPKRIVEAEREAAGAVLDEQVRTLREADKLSCEAWIVEGEPFEGICGAAEDAGADLVVIGPHRRRVLKDVFIGTTAERTIRSSRRPVLMANGVPAGPYRHVLVAIDLSACSAEAARVLRRLGLAENAVVSALHACDALGAALMPRASVSRDSINRYIEEEKVRAERELAAFLAALGWDAVGQIVRHNDSTAAHVISTVARQVTADLVVVGTRGRTGAARLLLGSVAEEVLSTASVDVLAVPPGDKPPG